jgi:hypothetical protein
MIKIHLRPALVVALAVGLAVSGTLTLAGPALAAKPKPVTTWHVPVMQEALEIAASGFGDCTAWRNTILPPPTIRVYREAYGPLEGTVEVVSLRTWSEQVLRTQMPAYYPMEALKANALTVKQYGWYYTINYRGGVAPDGNCYDVRDTGDGFYRPEVYTPAPQHLAAVAATWPYTVRKYDYSRGTSRFFLTGYRAGAFVDCGQETDGFHLFQHSAFDCGKQGMTWEGILRVFLEPKLELVDPGVHSLVGNVMGDAGVFDGSTPGALKARTYNSTGAHFTAPPTPTLGLDTTTLRQVVTGDVTGDRLDDVIAFIDTDAGPRLRISRANGAGYEDAVSWWTDSSGITNATTQVVADDFNADGRADVGLLVGAPPTGGKTRFYVMISTGSSFLAPTIWWSGKLDTSAAQALAGDADGDGRSDLIIKRALGPTTMEFLVAKSQLTGAALDAPIRWLALSDLPRDTTQAVIADTNRDGRDDVVVAYPSGAGSVVATLWARTTSTFMRHVLWTSTSMPISKLKIGSGDYNIDGRGDVLILTDRGASGSRLTVMLPNDTTGTVGTWFDDPDLAFDTARTY